MAELGYEVLGLDVDAEKIAKLAAARCRSTSPGWTSCCAARRRSGRLRFTTSYAEAAEFGDVHFICVGTPQRHGEYAADCATSTPRSPRSPRTSTRPCLVVGKSTVRSGTAERLAARWSQLRPGRRGGRGGLEPGVPAGGLRRRGHAAPRPDRRRRPRAERAETAAARGLRAADRGPGTPLRGHRLRHRRAGQGRRERLPGHQDLLHQRDGRGLRGRRRATSPSSPRRSATTTGSAASSCSAGLGFGGGCLPKDIRAFMARAGELGAGEALTLPARGRRDQHAPPRPRWSSWPGSAVRRRRSWARRVAVLGATFKPDSDDVRDSPALDVAGQIHLQGGAGHGLRPDGHGQRPRGSSRPSGYADRRVEAVRGADLVLHLTEWREFRELDPAALGERRSAQRDPGRPQRAGPGALARGRLDLPRPRPPMTRRHSLK